MSIPCGTFVDELCVQMQSPRGSADPVFISQVWLKLQEAYREITSAYSWSTLFANATLADSVYVVPADCRLINTVMDSNKTQYHFINGKNRRTDYQHNYFIDTPVATALAQGKTAQVSEYGTAVTSNAEFPSSSCVGEFLRLSDNTGLYRISAYTDASNITIADNFRGDSVSGGIFSIRPKGTMVLGFSDSRGNVLTPKGITIQYIRSPLPLYDPTDIIELPGDCQAVEIKALMKLLSMMGFNAAADKKVSELTAAMSAMKANEPAPVFIQPTDLFRRWRRGGIRQGFMRWEEYENRGQ